MSGLDQHRHGGVGGAQAVVIHVTPRIGGPKRCPAGAHRNQEFRLVGESEKALELAGEIGASAILDQRGGAYRSGRAGLPLRAPRREQGIKKLRRNRLLVKLEPDLDRHAPRLRRRSFGEIFHRFVETQLRNLPPIGIGREADAAGRRQSCASERREVCRLRPDEVGIRCVRFAKLNDEAARHFT